MSGPWPGQGGTRFVTSHPDQVSPLQVLSRYVVLPKRGVALLSHLCSDTLTASRKCTLLRDLSHVPRMCKRPPTFCH